MKLVMGCFLLTVPAYALALETVAQVTSAEPPWSILKDLGMLGAFIGGAWFVYDRFQNVSKEFLATIEKLDAAQDVRDKEHREQQQRLNESIMGLMRETIVAIKDMQSGLQQLKVIVYEVRDKSGAGGTDRSARMAIIEPTQPNSLERGGS